MGITVDYTANERIRELHEAADKEVVFIQNLLSEINPSPHILTEFEKQLILTAFKGGAAWAVGQK